MLFLLKINIVLLFLSLVVSCKTTQIQDISPNSVLNTSNYAANVYIGISGKMVTPEKEIDYAKLHIAHQMAMRVKCVVDEGAVSVFGRKNDFTISDSNFDYDDSYIDELMGYLEIIGIYTFSELTVVAAKDSRIPAEANPSVTRTAGERPRWVRNPEWVRNLPGLEDYFVGVGIADRYSLFYKGIRAADIRAAQAIAAEKGLFIRSYSLDRVNNYEAYIETGSIALSQAELEGFYILDRWVEPDRSVCYSLGIARKF